MGRPNNIDMDLSAIGETRGKLSEAVEGFSGSTDPQTTTRMFDVEPRIQRDQAPRMTTPHAYEGLSQCALLRQMLHVASHHGPRKSGKRNHYPMKHK